MKKYVKPSVQVISRNDLDIICTSTGIVYPVIPLSINDLHSAEEEDA